MAVIALAGIVAGAILLVLGVLTGDGIHCAGALCRTWAAAVILAAVSCLLAALCLFIAAGGTQPYMHRMVAGGAFAVAAVLTLWVPLGRTSIILALLALATFSFAKMWGSDNR
jgi:hypothetical protein